VVKFLATERRCIVLPVRYELIYLCYVEESRLPLWSSGENFWLQIQRSGFDSRHYQIFWDVVGLEWGAISLVSTIEKLLGRNSSGSVLETENTAVGIRHADHVTPSIRKKLSLTSPRSDGRSVGIVHPRTQATELLFILFRFNAKRNGALFLNRCSQRGFSRDWSVAIHPEFERVSTCLTLESQSVAYSIR
jgi:hypothetical protein